MNHKSFVVTQKNKKILKLTDYQITDYKCFFWFMCLVDSLYQ